MFNSKKNNYLNKSISWYAILFSFQNRHIFHFPLMKDAKKDFSRYFNKIIFFNYIKY